MSRTFRPDTKYDGRAWIAYVYANDATAPYWGVGCFTRAGAGFAAWRMARKLNRLEAEGKLL